MTWIDTWGETIAWLIRGALTVIGGALWFLPGWQQGQDPAHDEAPSEAHGG